jgi:hypothetical protein
MTNFSRSFTIDDEMFRICFSKIARMDTPKYYVAVKQDNQLVTAFEMKKHQYRNQWVVCQPAPDWITLQEISLGSMIEEATHKKNRQKSKEDTQHP